MRWTGTTLLRLTSAYLASAGSNKQPHHVVYTTLIECFHSVWPSYPERRLYTISLPLTEDTIYEWQLPQPALYPQLLYTALLFATDWNTCANQPCLVVLPNPQRTRWLTWLVTRRISIASPRVENVTSNVLRLTVIDDDLTGTINKT
jgi:hypothetical protein